MKITQDVRDYAATLSDNEKGALYLQTGSALSPHPEAAAQRPSKDAMSKDEAERGMADMSKKFLDMGAEVYVDADKAKESNKAL